MAITREFICVMIIALMGATGCAPEPEEGEFDAALIEGAVEDAVWAFHAADTQMNAEAVISLMWPEFSMLADGTRVTYDDAVAGSRSFMASLELFHTQWTDLQINVLDDKHAISTFLFRDSIRTKSGDLIQAQGPNSFVWEKREGEWRVLYADADHYPVGQ